MAKSAMKRQPAKTPAAIDLDAGLAGITAMNVEQLRELWRQKRARYHRLPLEAVPNYEARGCHCHAGPGTEVSGLYTVIVFLGFPPYLQQNVGAVLSASDLGTPLFWGTDAEIG
jgi:hypothetical protein